MADKNIRDLIEHEEALLALTPPGARDKARRLFKTWKQDLASKDNMKS